MSDKYNISTYNNRKLRILACPANQGGCAYYRIIMPMQKLAEKYGDKVEIRMVDNPLGITITNDEHGKAIKHEHNPDFEFEDMKWADVVFFHNIHQYGPQYTMSILKKAIELGKFTHYDTDDLLTDLYDGHRLMGMYKEQKLDELTKSLYYNSDLVTVTQSKFAERIQPYTRKALAVIRNAIDFELPAWNLPWKPPQRKKQTRIGWVGGIHHEEDVKEFKGSMLRVNAKVGKENLEWHFFGRPPLSYTPEGKPDRDWQQDVWDQYEKSLAFGAKRDRNTFFHTAMGCDTYGAMYTQMDVAIAPLQMNNFNDSKSEIKLIECGRYGIPLIASNVGCYSDVIKDWVHGYLIDPKNDPTQWTKVLTRLCKDKQLRKEMGQNLKQVVDEYYDINKSVGMRYDLYMEMIKLKEDALSKALTVEEAKDAEVTSGK